MSTFYITGILINSGNGKIRKNAKRKTLSVASTLEEAKEEKERLKSIHGSNKYYLQIYTGNWKEII